MLFKVFIILSLFFNKSVYAETDEESCLYVDALFVQRCCNQIVNKTAIKKYVSIVSKCQFDIFQSTDSPKPEFMSCDEHICANRCAGLANNEV